MIRPPRPGKNLTVDYRSALSGAQAGKGQSKEGSYLGGLTASQYAELFPDYFRRARPDIGISASGRLPGRQLPSAAALPGVGQPATAAGRAAQRAQSGAPGTQPSGPSGPSAVPSNKAWSGGTTQVNRDGSLPTRGGGPGGGVDLGLDGQADLSKVSVTQRRLAVYNSFRKQGLSHQAAVMFTGEMGRENDFRASYMFGNHKDSGRWNTGIMSWNSDRSDMNIDSREGRRGRLIAFLESKGLMKGNDIVPTQAALDAQVEFLIKEMETGSHIGGLSNQKAKRVAELLPKLRDPNAQLDYDEVHRVLGKDLIRWAYDRLPHHRQRMAEHEKLLQKEINSAKKLPGTASEAEEYLPDLALPSKEGLAEAGAPPKTATPVAKGRKPPIGFGDSVMNGLLSKHKGMERGYAKDGANPKQIFAQMQEWEKNNPGGLGGRDIHLSTGLLNNTGDVATARAMIEYLKSKGANVTLVGGPQGEGTRKDLVGVHAQVEALGKEFGVRVSPAYKPAEDGVHPTQEQLAKGFIETKVDAVKTYDVKSYAKGHPNMTREQLVQQNIDPLLVEAVFEGTKTAFGDPNDPRTRYVVQINNARRQPNGSSRHGIGAAVDVQIFDRETGKFVGGHMGGDSIFKNALGNAETFRHYEIWNQGMYKYIHDKYGKEAADKLTSGLYFNAMQTQGKENRWDNMHISIGEGQSLGSIRGGAGEHVQRLLKKNNAEASQPMGDISKWTSPLHPDQLNPEGALPYGDPNAPPPTATPVRTIRAEDGQTKKLMFDTGRAYTESDVKTMMARYGKDLVIGANLDTPEEYEKVRALAEKYGLGIHGYSKGRGAPQSGWGNQFPREQKEVQRLARERGISLNQWYNGGWMDYEIDRLKKLGVKAPHQIELDNANDAKDGNAFEQELLKYAQAGLNTRIVPKNWGEREYAAYHKLVEQKKIPADIVVPLNITETKHIQGTEGVTKKAGHSFGAMPADNIGRYATTEPLQQPPPVQTEPVKQNAYGGVAQAYNSKEDVMFAQAGKGIIGGVAPGETIRYDKDGQITVVPGHRSDANALSDRSGKEADARVHAMTTIADANEHGSAMAMVPTPPQPSPQVGQSNVRTIDNPPVSPSQERAMAKIQLDDHGGYAMQTSRIFSVI